MEILVGLTQAHPEFGGLFGQAGQKGDLDEWGAASSERAPAIVALDCEMVCTASDAMQLGRVTVVGSDGEVNGVIQTQFRCVYGVFFFV